MPTATQWLSATSQREKKDRSLFDTNEVEIITYIAICRSYRNNNKNILGLGKYSHIVMEIYHGVICPTQWLLFKWTGINFKFIFDCVPAVEPSNINLHTRHI